MRATRINYIGFRMVIIRRCLISLPAALGTNDVQDNLYGRPFFHFQSFKQTYPYAVKFGTAGMSHSMGYLFSYWGAAAVAAPDANAIDGNSGRPRTEREPLLAPDDVDGRTMGQGGRALTT